MAERALRKPMAGRAPDRPRAALQGTAAAEHRDELEPSLLLGKAKAAPLAKVTAARRIKVMLELPTLAGRR